ncbi:MAG: protein kinase, partial [Planctomycetota bacterium]
LDHFNSGQRRSRENITAVQHCDIKPQNMLLVGDVVQVCDFGLARAQGEVRATSNTMASLAYAAPEMVRPPHDPSPTTDQYSLALSYIELRTGRLPYTELSPLTIMRAKVDGTIDLSDVPPIEAKVLARALQIDPTQRWPSCVDFAKALRAAAGTIADTGRFVVSAPLGATPVIFPPPSEPATSVQTADSPQPGSSAKVAPPAAQQPGVKRRGVPRGGLWAALAAAGLLLLAGIVALRPGAIPPVPAPPSPDPQRIERAEALERQGDLVGAGTVYAEALSRQPSDLASVLWNLQTRAADEHRPADCVPLLERLEKLYAAAPPPQVKGIGRWDIVNSLAWYKATLPGGNAAAGREAQRLAAEALTLVGSDPQLRAQTLDVAAAAAARAEQWDMALQQIDAALALLKDPAEQAEFRRRRSAYAAHQPWQEP